MKTKLHLLALLTSAMVLHGCGGGDMLGSSDADDHKLIPEEVTEDLTRPRPSENAPVMKTEGTRIYWADGNETIVRGVNLQYSDNPLQMITAFPAIAETGANFVRIQLSEETSEVELEAALNMAIENNMAAILTLNSPNLKCNDDEALFTEAVEELWLEEWLPIIAQDRYQDKIMVNMASGWGPKAIFNGSSFGYRTYIDTHKAVIRRFRRAGLKFPLVIDAPGCGEDFHAFESIRATELMAADEQKNLVFSVHAYGSTWNNRTKIDYGISRITSQNVPVIVSEFGGSDLGDSPVKLHHILERGAGDYALEIDTQWKTPDDKAGIMVPFSEPVDATNSEIAFEVHIDESFAEYPQMGMQLYLRDVNGEYANLSWHTVENFDVGAWNSRKYTVKNKGSFGWASDAFDITQVARIGIELIANGKPVEVGGKIQLDNLRVINSSAAIEMASMTFDADLQGWTDNGKGTISYGDGYMSAMPDAEGNIEAITNSLPSVDFSKPVRISAKVMVPEKYAGSWIYFKFFNNVNNPNNAWFESTNLGGDSFTYGEWTEVSVDATFPEGITSIGIQMGNIGKTSEVIATPDEAILFDDIVISTVEESAYEYGVQYSGTFDADADGWAYISWGGAANVDVSNGVMNVTPKDPGTARIDIQKGNIDSVEKLNLQDPFVVKTRVFLPASLEGTGFNLQFYMQDSGWANHFEVINLSGDELTYGDWNDFDVEVAFPEAFSRVGAPKHIGFSFMLEGGSLPMNDPIQIDEVIFEGLIEVEKEEEVRALVDFHYVHQGESVAVDIAEGGIVADDYADKFAVSQRSAPFSWAAWSWYGNASEFAGWDMTTTIDSLDGITDRGVEIVLGKGGIVETLLGSVPDDEAAE